MKDGDVAIIREWGDCLKYRGRIVQRYKDDLVSLGRGEGASWPGLFARPRDLVVLVEILKPGSTLEIAE